MAHAEDEIAAAMQPTRTTMLDLTSTEGKYMATDGTVKTVNFTEDPVTDSAEGWSWNPETKTLTLSGARIVVTEPVLTPNKIQVGEKTTGYYYGVRLPGADVTVVLTEGTENIIQAGDAAGETPEGIVAGSVGMGDADNFNNSVTIRGSGKLTVKGGKPANGGNTSGRVSAGINFYNVIVKDSAKLETCGNKAENTLGAAYSRGVLCSHITIEENARTTATGGNVSAVKSRESSGISATRTLIIDGNAILKAYGGDVTKNPDATSNEWSTSMGIRAADFKALANASVYAYGGKTYGELAGSSMGVYIHKEYKEYSEAKLSDNAFLYAEGGQAGGSSYGIRGDRNPQQQSLLTIENKAYVEAVGKEIGKETHCECKGIITYGMTINGGTVIASAETTAEQGSIAAISLLTQPPLPTYKEDLTPTVTAGESEGFAESADATSAETYAKRWVKIQTSEPMYAIAAAPSVIDFGVVKTAYAQPGPKTVTITNTGNETVELAEAVLQENSNYTVSKLSESRIAPRRTAEITVQPKENLPAGEYNETLTIPGSNNTSASVKLKFNVIKSGSGGSGGGSYIPVQKPTILAGEGFQTMLSADGTKLTITAAAGYEIQDVLLNGASKGSVTELSGLKTGDKVEIKTAKKADNPPSDDASLSAVNGRVSKMLLYARSSRTPNKNIKVVLKMDKRTAASIETLKKLGYTVKYKFYRSTKKSSAYKAKITKKTKTYINTSGKKGARYYYKARIMVYDKNGKLVAQTELKQCQYACRVR